MRENMTREQEEKDRRRRQYLAIMFAKKRAAESALPFKTFEQLLLEKIGVGILQSELTNDELARALKLMTTKRPKLMTKFSSKGVIILPYKSGR